MVEGNDVTGMMMQTFKKSRETTPMKTMERTGYSTDALQKDNEGY